MYLPRCDLKRTQVIHNNKTHDNGVTDENVCSQTQEQKDIMFIIMLEKLLVVRFVKLNQPYLEAGFRTLSL